MAEIGHAQLVCSYERQNELARIFRGVMLGSLTLREVVEKKSRKDVLGLAQGSKSAAWLASHLLFCTHD